MKDRRILLPVLLSIALVFGLVLTTSTLNATPVMARGQAALMVAPDTRVSAEFYHPPECDVGNWTDIVQVAAAWHHTVGLRSDSTVVAVGEDRWEQCNVGGWTNIAQVAAGGYHTVAVKSDGTVVSMGRNDYGCCNVGDWAEVMQVSTGYYHTVGLKLDGTVVAVGRNDHGQCDVGNWTDIIQVAAGDYHTVGLKSDGRVVALGLCKHGQCDVGNWTDIVQVAAGFVHTVGLKSNGTVVAAADDEDCSQCDVGGWRDIINVAAGKYHTLGLKSDGTVVAACIWLTTIVPGPECFIATAAYGTPMTGEIEILRRFRDEYLLTNPLGQALVDFYYRVSPPMADFIIKHPSLKPMVRAGLVPPVAISALVVNTTLAERAAILGLLVLVSVALAVWVAGRAAEVQNTPEGEMD